MARRERWKEKERIDWLFLHVVHLTILPSHLTILSVRVLCQFSSSPVPFMSLSFLSLSFLSSPLLSLTRDFYGKKIGR